MFKNLSTSSLGISGHRNEIIELVLSYRFKGMDIEMVEFASQVKSRGMHGARRLIDSANIKLGSFPLPVDWAAEDSIYQKDLDRLPQLAELAAELDCRRSTTTIEPASEDRPYHENFEFHRERFSEIAEALQPFGVQLGLQFRAAAEHRQGKRYEFLHAFDALLLLCKSVGAQNVGVVLDIWDWHVSGATMKDIQALSADKIVTVQVADLREDADLETIEETSRRLPGETGVIDAAAILVVLAELGYDGPVTPVPHRSYFQGKRRDEAVKIAGAHLNRLWNAAGLSPSGKLLATAEKK